MLDLLRKGEVDRGLKMMAGGRSARKGLVVPAFPYGPMADISSGVLQPKSRVVLGESFASYELARAL